MEPFQALAVIICLAAGFSYINYRYLALPMTIGLMLISLTLSILLLVAESLGLGMMDYADRLLSQIDFRKVLLDGMLGLLLFAGALHVNINDLAEKKYEVGILATLGTAASTLIVGGAVPPGFPGFGFGFESGGKPVVRSADIADRSDCGFGHTEKGPARPRAWRRKFRENHCSMTALAW